MSDNKSLSNPNNKKPDLYSYKETSLPSSESPTINVGSVRKEMPISPEVSTASSANENSYSDYKVKQHKKDIKLRITLGIIAGILGLILGIAAFVLWYTQSYMLSKITYITQEGPYTFVDESGNTVVLEDLIEDTENEIIDDENVTNFLLIGIDSRSSYYNSNGTGGLADVIMVMSVNTETGTIRMISIARDSYAYVPGYSNPMKINAAMSLGGPDVLSATIENQLRIDIDGYAYVNFYNMASVIDAVGGVYVDVSDAELNCEGGLNWNLSEVNNLAGVDTNFQHVTSSGPNTWLNGRQAVAYARIRKLDSDYMRSQRQVEVLRSLLNQFMGLSVDGKARALTQILGLVATNISQNEINAFAIDFLPSLQNVTIEYMQLPISSCFNSGMYGSEWSIRPNWNGMIPYVQTFFYGRQIEFDPVRDIDGQPPLSNCQTVEEQPIEGLLR